jgi:ParB/RepB/Spo0J family partition protein
MTTLTAKQPRSEAIYRRDSMNLLIDEIIVGERFRVDLGDLDSLVESIKAIGLLHPIVVTKDNKLLAGRRRLEAHKKLGLKDIPVTVVATFDDALKCLRIERDENTCRLDLTPEERYKMGTKLTEMERPKTKQRQVEGGSKGGRGSLSTGVDKLDSGLSSSVYKPNEELEGAQKDGGQRAVNAVGPAVGLHPRQWSRLKHVGDKAATGDKEAQQILKDINEGKESIAGGYEKVKNPPEVYSRRYR